MAFWIKSIHHIYPSIFYIHLILFWVARVCQILSQLPSYKKEATLLTEPLYVWTRPWHAYSNLFSVPDNKLIYKYNLITIEYFFLFFTLFCTSYLILIIEVHALFPTIHWYWITFLNKKRTQCSFFSTPPLGNHTMDNLKRPINGIMNIWQH